MVKTAKSLQSLEAEDLNRCPDCGSRDLDYDKGERYCKKCGFVLD